MMLTENIFKEICENKNIAFKITYSGRLKPYGAYALYNKSLNFVEFRLSKKWRGISDDIKIGLLQELMAKLLKIKKRTMNIDLYNSFIRNLHKAIPKTKIEPLLKESFDRVNEKYFFGMADMPNLKFGNESTVTLGHYDFKTDAITISKIFEKHPELLDYVMYHELLHKKFKFKNSGMKNLYHSKRFKEEEKRFEGSDDVQAKIKKVILKRKIKTKLFGF